jgi:hypothetical protein
LPLELAILTYSVFGRTPANKSTIPSRWIVAFALSPIFVDPVDRPLVGERDCVDLMFEVVSYKHLLEAEVEMRAYLAAPVKVT